MEGLNMLGHSSLEVPSMHRERCARPFRSLRSVSSLCLWIMAVWVALGVW